MPELNTEQQFHLEKQRIQLDEKKIYLDGLKLLAGTLLLGIITAYLPHIIEKVKLQNQQAKDERDYVKEFMNYALVEDIESRLRFSLYFSHVTPDDKQRELWKNYHQSLSKLKEAANIERSKLLETRNLKIEAGDNKSADLLDEKLIQIERQLSPLKDSNMTRCSSLEMPPLSSGGTKAGRMVLQQALIELNKCVRELPAGSNDSPEIRKYLSTVGVKTPSGWSGAFLYWCLLQAGQADGINPTGSLDILYKQLKTRAQELENNSDILPGDLIFMKAIDGRIVHAGIVHTYFDGIITSIEGNISVDGGRTGQELAARTRTRQHKLYLRLRD